MGCRFRQTNIQVANEAQHHATIASAHIHKNGEAFLMLLMPPLLVQKEKEMLPYARL